MIYSFKRAAEFISVVFIIYNKFIISNYKQENYKNYA
ncbi:Hypothetical protein CCH01_002040 [Clostridium chauvoei JF4335]|nr:Hypothetical protein CCH01_002040 [Clostridium chauvoei JF4335]